MPQLAPHMAAVRETAAINPLRCEVLGTSPQARFHREALAIRDSFQLVEANAELLFIAVPVNDRAAQAIAALRAGQSVVIEAPVALAAAETAAVFEAAAEQHVHCEVWLPRRQELDFLQALKTLRTGEIGKLRRATLTLRQLAPWMLPQPESLRRASLELADDEQTLGVLATFGGHFFDLLLEFVGSIPTRVFGRLSDSTLSFDTLEGCSAAAGIDTGFIAVVEFSNGCVAQLDIDLASSLNLGPSWTLQGQRGGYAAGRQSITVADGEVYEVPVLATGQDPYAALLAHLRTGLDHGVGRFSCRTDNPVRLEHNTDRIVRATGRLGDQGSFPTVEDYVTAHAPLGSQDDVLAQLVEEEFRVRQRHGDTVSVDEFVVRFPRLETRLRQKLPLLATSLRRVDEAAVAANQVHSPLRDFRIPLTSQQNPRPQEGLVAKDGPVPSVWSLRNARVNSLMQVMPFSSLSSMLIGQLAERMTEREFAANAWLSREGADADELNIILASSHRRTAIACESTK